MRDNHLTHAAIFRVLLNHNQPAGFAHGFFNRSRIPGHDRAKIDEFDADLVADFVEGFERFLNCIAPRDQGDIRAFAHITRFAQRNRADWLRCIRARPKADAWEREKSRVLCMHRRPEQSGGVGRRAWNHNVQTGIMGERRFVRLAVPQTAAGQIRAIRGINHRRTFPIPK